MTSDDRRLVLVVDPDSGFVDEVRGVVREHRSLAARDLSEAREIALGGRLDLVVLGPAFASEHSISESAVLRQADPGLQIVLAADIVTNRLLKAALRAGFSDVLDLPVTAQALAEVLTSPSMAAPVAPSEIELIVEPAEPAEESHRAPPAHHPSQYHPDPDPDPDETIAFEEAWAAAAMQVEPTSSVPPEPERTSADPPLGVTAPRTDSPQPDPVPESLSPPEPDTVRSGDEQPVSPTPSDAATPPDADEPTMPPSATTEPPPAPAREPFQAPEPAPVWPRTAEPQPMPEPEPPLDAEPAQGVAPPPSEPEPSPEPEPQLPADPIPAPPSVPPPVPPAIPDSESPDTEPDQPEPSDSPEAESPEPTVRPPVPPSITAPDETTRPAATRGPGRVVAVMAGKGGSGKSVVATNLAIALGLRNDPERVAIVDADLQFGDVALMLGVDPVRTIDDVIGRLDSMTDARLDGALLRHESGLRVLPAPLLPVRHDEITAKSVVEVVDRLRGLYDTIVVDTGPVFDDGLITMLEHADAVVAVVDMDLPSVKNSKVALDALRSFGYPMDRITLVVNRVNSKARLDLAELERSLGLRVGGSVPSDRIVPQSVNEGIPLLALSPRSKVARSFLALAERLDPEADRARLGGGGR